MVCHPSGGKRGGGEGGRGGERGGGLGSPNPGGGGHTHIIERAKCHAMKKKNINMKCYKMGCDIFFSCIVFLILDTTANLGVVYLCKNMDELLS